MFSGEKKITTAQSKQPKKTRVVRWFKVVVMFLGFGFVFPHAMTEDDEDTTKHWSHKGTEIKHVITAKKESQLPELVTQNVSKELSFERLLNKKEVK